MTVKHIFEGLVETGLFVDEDPADARAWGVLSEYGGDFRQVKSAWDLCESPIEKVMAVALYYSPSWPKPVEIHAQHVVGNYRADFLVTDGTNGIDVECDGKDFHSHGITMERYRADRRRDQFFISSGIEVIRFKGSEIWVNPTGCAHEVTQLMCHMEQGIDG